ncbi:MAG: hypothetical protein A2177_12690 [Spirochaetes bacterium RBG_13_68_11]|nr:MAG: hypothetical protein A2177_12690 [Spirochaetes bacterium RBG_13_68_11]
MQRKYLVGSFVCTFSCWTYGNGTLPLLPLSADQQTPRLGRAGSWCSTMTAAEALEAMSAAARKFEPAKMKIGYLASTPPGPVDE